MQGRGFGTRRMLFVDASTIDGRSDNRRSKRTTVEATLEYSLNSIGRSGRISSWMLFAPASKGLARYPVSRVPGIMRGMASRHRTRSDRLQSLCAKGEALQQGGTASAARWNSICSKVEQHLQQGGTASWRPIRLGAEVTDSEARDSRLVDSRAYKVARAQVLEGLTSCRCTCFTWQLCSGHVFRPCVPATYVPAMSRRGLPAGSMAQPVRRPYAQPERLPEKSSPIRSPCASTARYRSPTGVAHPAIGVALCLGPNRQRGPSVTAVARRGAGAGAGAGAALFRFLNPHSEERS
jgi:hypothetical protein